MKEFLTENRGRREEEEDSLRGGGGGKVGTGRRTGRRGQEGKEVREEADSPISKNSKLVKNKMP